MNRRPRLYASYLRSLKGGFGDCGLRRELGTPVTAVRVVRIHLTDDDEAYHIFTGKINGIRAR